jgi:BASS family bile acid:Na+ symporter
MTVDQLINVLVTVMLVEMMVAIGLRIPFSNLVSTVTNWRLMLQAVLANYVCVPAAAVGLLLLFGAEPMIAAGFLVLAVCPGAPFGPSCTSLARGNVPVAVGLMAVLAASSAVAAPLLLYLLLPLMAGNDPLQVDAVKIVRVLAITQLLPLLVGLCIRHWRPGLAEKLQKPADRLSALLGLLTVCVILFVHFPLLMEIRLRGYAGMSALLVASWVAGWLLGGPGSDNRKAMTLTTALRNVGVGLVIAASNFPGTAAVTACLAYGLFEIAGTLLLAFWWGRRASAWSTETRFGIVARIRS